jgi:hypothetical protein
MKNAYGNLYRMPEGRIPLGRPMHRWKERIKI